jgi:hypothetical protein
MFVTAYGTRYDCARAVKGSDYIRLYDAAGTLIASFDGIADFSGYTIEGGTWEAPLPTEKERLDALEAAMLEMILGV